MNVRMIEHAGVERSLKGWADHTGIPFSTIAARLRAGWTVADALTVPSNRKFAKGGRPAAESVRRAPELKCHKASNKGYARWWSLGTRHTKYFGPWGTEETKAKYRQWAAEWDGGAPKTASEGDGLMIAGLVDAWLDHCARTYRKRGTITSEVYCCRAAVVPLVRIYGHTSPAEFDGRKLQTVREAMVSEGWVRKTINDHCARLCRMFSWAVAEKLVPADVAQSVERVEPLAAGRREDVAESAPVGEVPAADIAAVLGSVALDRSPERRKLLADLIRLQLLTGMRPGEICSLDRADIDRIQTPWLYEVRSHNKMLHKDIAREVYFGPLARAILTPYLAGDAKGPVFVLTPYRAGAEPRPVTPQFYCRAVAAACKATGVPVWTPNQLRHNRATEVMDATEDDEAVAAVLGNSPEVARQVYVGKHRAGAKVAKRIAETTG